MNVVAVNAVGVLSASTVRPPSSVNELETVPLDAIVTFDVSCRFLANSQLLDFFLQLIDKSRFGRARGLTIGPHGCALLFGECRDGRF